MPVVTVFLQVDDNPQLAAGSVILARAGSARQEMSALLRRIADEVERAETPLAPAHTG